MTERLIDILPLIHQLAQKKPITQGLIISPMLVHAGWPGNWQSIDLPHLEHLPFTIRYDLAVVDLVNTVVNHNLSSDYEDKSHVSKADKPTNQADSQAVKPTDHHSCHQPNTPNLLAQQKIITQGLTRLRDLLARQVLVLATAQHSSLLHALGFSQIENLTQNTIIWQFNILSYKQTPDWLNSKYWANPENWDKYRW